jgi:hypothetical protein
MKKNILILFMAGIISFSLSSCSVTLPSFRKTNLNTDISINNASSQIEDLKREDYEILTTSTGSASSSKFYFLFIPIGNHKSNSELYDNAYYNAIEKIPNADGLILPRQKNKKLIIPLILINYYRRDIVVSGVAISVKGKTISKPNE